MTEWISRWLGPQPRADNQHMMVKTLHCSQQAQKSLLPTASSGSAFTSPCPVVYVLPIVPQLSWVHTECAVKAQLDTERIQCPGPGLWTSDGPDRTSLTIQQKQRRQWDRLKWGPGNLLRSQIEKEKTRSGRLARGGETPHPGEPSNGDTWTHREERPAGQMGKPMIQAYFYS